ncbi:MAG TPA: amidohydrolase family protein [Clostridia bacterium]|nr:amidohydrolase family protein [Clostridia bacterium]
MKKLICGGMVYDGSGCEPARADVLVSGGVIKAVGPGLDSQDVEAQRIDAAGMAVTPAFIDMHRHCDAAPFRDAQFGHLELAQGIATTVVGNCGLAPVPLRSMDEKTSRAFLAPVTGEIPHMDAFLSYAAYFSALHARALPINMGVLAGTGAIKVAVKGFSNTPYTPEEIRAAQGLLGEAMQEGAFGASLGLMYQPECYTTPDEQAQVILPAAKAGGVLTAHIRGEGDSLVSSVKEVIGIARKAGIRLNISHFKSTGIRNWNDKIYAAMEQIENARAEGMDVTADFYPYAGGSTTLVSLVPPHIWGEGDAQTLRYLGSDAGKRKMRAEIESTHAGWDNMALSIGWDRILIASVQDAAHADYSGKDMASLATQLGYAHPSDLMCDLLASEGGQVGIIVLCMDPSDVDAVAKLPYTALISDALYSGGLNPHPRLYGAFPRLIQDLVVTRKVLAMREAVHKMTGMPARIMGMKGRGFIRPGYAADINLFVPENLAAPATYTASRTLSTGMARVMIGGETVFENETVRSGQAGRLLRRTP